MTRRILYIDPVPSSNAELQPIARYLGDIKANDTQLEVVSLRTQAPLHVTFPSYEALASAPLLKVIRYGVQNGFDAIISGCFYDPMVTEAREIAAGSVVLGPCLSALQVAAQLANRVSILSANTKARYRTEQRVHEYGYQHMVSSVRDIGLSVEDFSDPHTDTFTVLLEEGRKAIAGDGAEALILGCSMNFSDYHPLQEALGVPVIECTSAALKKAELHAELKQRFSWATSQAGSLTPPPVKEIEDYDLFDDKTPPIGARIIVN